MFVFLPGPRILRITLDSAQQRFLHISAILAHCAVLYPLIENWLIAHNTEYIWQKKLCSSTSQCAKIQKRCNLGKLLHMLWSKLFLKTKDFLAFEITTCWYTNFKLYFFLTLEQCLCSVYLLAHTSYENILTIISYSLWFYNLSVLYTIFSAISE